MRHAVFAVLAVCLVVAAPKALAAPLDDVPVDDATEQRDLPAAADLMTSTVDAGVQRGVHGLDAVHAEGLTPVAIAGVQAEAVQEPAAGGAGQRFKRWCWGGNNCGEGAKKKKKGNKGK